jgi:hypothetical protein
VDTQAYALALLAHLRRVAAEPAEAERLARRAEQLALDIDHRRRQMMALVHVAEACLDEGDVAASQGAAEAALELAASLGAHGQARDARLVLAQLAADAGGVEDALAKLSDVNTEAASDADFSAQMACAALRAEFHARFGRKADLAAQAEICEQQARASSEPSHAADAVVAAALARANIGTESEAYLALALADSAILSADAGGFVLLGLRARLARCCALGVLGDPGAAAERALLVSEAEARGLPRLARDARWLGPVPES